ncbi:MAG TPA: hypothetical protein VH724_19370 [Candidatus Angelobacter sp.]|nr:hypothetical protein [Candidatus Angelobacter sp.]
MRTDYKSIPADQRFTSGHVRYVSSGPQKTWPHTVNSFARDNPGALPYSDGDRETSARNG